MLAANRNLFSYPLADRQQQCTSSLQSFISFTTPVVKLSVKQEADMGTGFRTIGEYFRPHIPPELAEIIHPMLWRQQDSSASLSSSASSSTFHA